MKKNQLGAYGPWVAALTGAKPAALSFRNPKFASLSTWKKAARAKVLELLAVPQYRWRPAVRVEKRFVFDGLDMEALSWQLPYGPRTRAIFMKPAGVKGKLPAILGMHDHGAKKFWGLEKITRVSTAQHPLLREHQAENYSGRAWANEIAKRGYAVLVHDTFLFSSRRTRYSDLPPEITGGRREKKRMTRADIDGYNKWSGQYEDIMAKSLFCSGTTWPGLYFREDQCALDYLCARPDVDASRVGCGGLSGGGLRTVMLGGLDERIRVAVPAGFMSSWRDFLMNKSHTHTWMTYVPRLPLFLDFPEILGLRVPLPVFVLNDIHDPLYTLEGMHAADHILRGVYKKAGALAHYKCAFYPGPHKLDLRMQQDAFDWFDRYLK